MTDAALPQAWPRPSAPRPIVIVGKDARLVSPVEDAVKTMALVEACYVASETPGTPIPE